MKADTPHPRGPLPEPPLLERDFTARDLPLLRVLVAARAADEGLAEPRLGDFVLAVSEVAANAVEHGGGTGTLQLRRVGPVLECRVTDRGPGFAEDVIPDTPPALTEPPRGRGLWVARLVTDRLTVGAGPAGALVTLAMTVL